MKAVGVKDMVKYSAKIMIPLAMFMVLALAVSATEIFIKLDSKEDAINFASMLEHTRENFYYNLGVLLYRQNNYDAAVKAFDKAISIDEDYGLPYYSKAIIYRELGELDKASLNFEKSAELEKTPSRYFDLGIIYVEIFRNKESEGKIAMEDLEFLKKGLASYQMAVDLDPDFPHASENLVIVKSVLDFYLGEFS